MYGIDDETKCKIGEEAVRYISDENHWGQGAYIRIGHPGDISYDLANDNVRNAFALASAYYQSSEASKLQDCQVCVVGNVIRACVVNGIFDTLDWHDTLVVLINAAQNVIRHGHPCQVTSQYPAIHEINDSPVIKHSEIVEITEAFRDRICAGS
ncbi:MAG TPA: hypothetical protein VF077_01525 [Nitrospiraceae bacterium]